MVTFAVTFRIYSDSSYQRRCDSLIETARNIGGGVAKIWDETTSFFILNADGSASEIAAKLYLQSDFNAATDGMVVIDVHSGDYATKGDLKNLITLGTLMKHAPKLS